VFSSVYLLSPCCLNQELQYDKLPIGMLRADSIRTFEEFQKADFGTRIFFASAAAWSPNPDRPPFFLDLPVRDGQLQPLVLARWAANRPLFNLDQYIYNLRQLKAIGFDAGTQDKGIAASIQQLDSALNKYGIRHQFEIYDGNHTNKIADRMAGKMLTFFSENLRFK
jgi:S-formylglutathione hydrolase